MEAFSETLTLIAEEVAADPMRLVLEFVQFAILMVAFYVLAIGFGKRKGIIVNALDRHAGQVDEELAFISSAPRQLADAEVESKRILEESQEESTRLVAQAEEQAATLRAESKAQVDVEVAAILDGAKGALDMELSELQAGMRDSLISIVAEATRSVMNEHLSLPEQRDLIERSILASIEDQNAETGPSAPPRRVMKHAREAI